MAVESTHPADLRRHIGTAAYYRHRHADFTARHPARPAPDYYLAYGDKYARRFTEVVLPQLSAAGRRWGMTVLGLLQEAIEARRTHDPAAFSDLELRPRAFRRFAFTTHSTAYLQAGLAGLPAQDVLRILHAPDRRDLLQRDAIGQMAITAAGLVYQPRLSKSMSSAMRSTVPSLKVAWRSV